MTDATAPRTLHDVLLQTCQSHPLNDAFIYRAGGEEHVVNYRKFREDVLLLSRALERKKVHAGSKVLLLSDNRYAWIVSDFALLALGAVSVPRGSDAPQQELEYIYQHAECEFLIVENRALLEKHAELFARLDPRYVFLIEGEAEHQLFSALYSYNELLSDRRITPADVADFAARGAQLEPDQVFSLIYTSGTTGNPKGVMLTHRNILHNLWAIPQIVPLDAGDRWLSVLPTWHIFERTAEYMTLASGGCTVYSSVKSFANDLLHFQPTLVCSVPRLWEALYERINDALAESGKGKARLFNLLVRTSAAWRRNRRVLHDQLPQFKRPSHLCALRRKSLSLIKLGLLALPYLLARKKLGLVQQRFGGRLKLAVSGGGSLPGYLDEWLDALGIRIVNAYGMTECAPGIAGRGVNCTVFGTLGPPLPGTALRIADEQDRPLPTGAEGEIQVHGPQVMPGYYNNPEENTRAFTADGYLRTGDLGRLTVGGELVITGRSKEIIVLANGENVDPSRIEGAITMLPFVKDAVLVGQDRRGLAALVVPDLDKLRDFAREKLQQVRHAQEELLDDQGLVDKVRQEINRLLHPKRGFKSHERLHGLSFLQSEFAPGEELTNTLKKKRHVIERKYAALIDRLFH